MMLGNENIDQVDSFIYQVSLMMVSAVKTSKDGKCSNDVKMEVPRPMEFSSQVVTRIDEKKINLRAKIKILVVTVVTVI